jgi:hypothetical protein
MLLLMALLTEIIKLVSSGNAQLTFVLMFYLMNHDI